jgi:CxxC motif-containing protein (DUF1111 family)
MPRMSLNGIVVSLAALALASPGVAQTDPGVRGGAAGAGGQIAGLTGKEGKFFSSGQDAFEEAASVLGTVPNTEEGLGPRFNLDSCAGCHKFPAVGGSSPVHNPQVDVGPPAQVAVVVGLGLISPNGPVREIRFNQPGDGGVHDLFTVVGLPGTPASCNNSVLPQPNFAGNLGNIIFRVPTPTFGAGLIEAISDSTIATNEIVTPLKTLLGVTGHANRSGNDGTITRFGWKAQNKSLMIFAGEAYNVEQGITNDLFPDDRGEGGVQDPLVCRAVPAAQDHTHYDLTQPQKVPGDAISFATFMRFLAPPAPATSYGSVTAASIANGAGKFASAGCAACHIASLPTGNHDTVALANKTANLYSDLLVHNMGVGLADGVSQGNANGNEFRTAPLWGLGQRVFFLHDGRTSDLVQAIAAHSSTSSEANAVIGNFSSLPVSDQQDILNFLRSL